MKKFVAFCLVLVFCLPAIAVEDGPVMYVGGTALGVNAGVVGHLDTTVSRIAIPTMWRRRLFSRCLNTCRERCRQCCRRGLRRLASRLCPARAGSNCNARNSGPASL